VRREDLILISRMPPSALEPPHCQRQARARIRSLDLFRRSWLPPQAVRGAGTGASRDSAEI